MSKPRVVAFIQARLTSSRLPNKVLAKIGSWTALELMLKRLGRATTLDQTVLLIPDTAANDPLRDYIEEELTYPFFRGSEHDVLGRFVEASQVYPADYYVRLTADCPLLCPEIVDKVVTAAIDLKADYQSNTNPPTFPDGFDVECVSSRALDWCGKFVSDPTWREHVTMGLRQSPDVPRDFKFSNLTREGESLAHIRLTLDTSADLEFIGGIVGELGDNAPLATSVEIESQSKQFLNE
jgi:spore coat polysaccharide biosynthesis protein SpsF (cytidylyltransferase family)